MALSVGSGSVQLAREAVISLAPIAPQTVNVEEIEIKGLREDTIPLVQIPNLPLGVFVVRSECLSINLLRFHIYNVTSSTQTPGTKTIRVIVI